MRCNQAKDLISLAFDEPLEEYDRARLAEHMDTCPTCESHQQVLTRGRDLLAEGMVEPSENFEWKVQLAIQRELRAGAQRRAAAPPRGRFWLPAGVTTGLVAAVVVVLGWVLLPGDRAGDLDGAVAQDLRGGVRPTFVQNRPTAQFEGLQHSVGVGSQVLPGKEDIPFGVDDSMSRAMTVLFQERDVILREMQRLQLEVYRLQTENTALREAVGNAKLQDATRGEQ